MNKVKRQHYVPQSYLKNFLNKEKQIFAFDKLTQKSFPSEVSKVAVEGYFYDFPKNPAALTEDEQTVEKFFSELEGKQAAFFRHIQKKIDGIFNLRNLGKTYSTKVLTQDQKLDLSYIIAFQWLRTRESRDFLLEMRKVTKPLSDKWVEQEIDKIINQCILEYPIQLDEEDVSEIKYFLSKNTDDRLNFLYNRGESVIHAKFMFSHYEELSQILRNHIWLIGINDTGKPLFTSDHPVVRQAHLSLNGIDSEGIEIVFPLNSKAILIMREKSHFYKFANHESQLFPLTFDDVDYYNTLQVYYSNRFVFCSENDFEIAKNICKNNPEVCSKDRTRVTLQEISQDQEVK